MGTSQKSRNPNLMNPIRKYWCLCFFYLFSSYALTHSLVLGSSKIADATNHLFGKEAIVLQEFLFPFIVLMLLGGAAAFGKSYSKNTFGICMQTDIRNMLVSKLVKIRTQYFDNEGTGALMNKLLSDVYQIEALFAECIPEFMVALITIIMVCTYIGMQSGRLLLVTVICYPLLLWIANKLTQMVGKVAAVTSAVDVETEQGIQEVLREISRNRTVITIAHRLSTIADADEIYVFENGEIVRREVRANVIQ